MNTKFNERPLIYLASPYTHKDPKVAEERFHKINRAAAKLMNEGHNVFSPISMCHPISMAHDLPTTWEFWKSLDYAFLSCSYKLVVLKLDGYKESVGVNAEIKIAKEMGIVIEEMEEI